MSFSWLTWLLDASDAFACAVCGTNVEDKSTDAFFQGTILLSLVPLVVIGGITFYIYRRSKAAEAEALPPPGAAPARQQ